VTIYLENPAGTLPRVRRERRDGLEGAVPPAPARPRQAHEPGQAAALPRQSARHIYTLSVVGSGKCGARPRVHT